LFAAGIIVLIVLGAIIYIVWWILLNRGTVIFSGIPPYTISIGDKVQECMEGQCSISISSGEYNYSVSKSGYYDQTGYIEVKRWSEEVIEVSLEYIAEVMEGQEYEIFQLPLGYGKFTNNLLSVSRIESGRMELDLEQISPEEMISSIIEELKNVAKSKNIYLKLVKTKGALPKISADKEKMRQVILNLIDNAIRYTKKGGVTVTLEKLPLKRPAIAMIFW